MPSLSPELSELERQFASAKTEALGLVTGLTSAQFNWRPQPHSWSIAECLLHLNMVGHRSVGTLERILEEAKLQGRTGQGPFRYGLFGKRLLERTEPPPRRRFRAPQSFRPVDDQPVKAVLPTFLHLQGQLTQRLEQANGLDLARIRVPAPGFKLVKVNVLVMLAWIAAHQRRHLWQAKQVREHAEFPRERLVRTS